VPQIIGIANEFGHLLTCSKLKEIDQNGPR